MKQAKKKKKVVWQQCVGYVFLMFIGVICGAAMVPFLEKSADNAMLSQRLFFFAGMCVALFFHLIAHEAGHLVFGLLTGYEFSSFRIGSFMWLKENGKLKFKRMKIAGTGGQCLMSPPDMKDGKIPIVLYNLGGSIINIVLGILFLAGYLLCTYVSFISLILLAFAVVGFISAMINGIPMRLGAVDNDGYNAFALSKNKEAVEAFWFQLKVNEQCAKGVRLKDMPAEWFTVPTDEAMKNSMAAVRGVFTCNRLLDEEKFEEADATMEHLLEIDSGIVGLHRNLMICDRIYVELIGENRSDIIESMMTKEQKRFMKSMKRFPSVLRVNYALALLYEKDTAKAETVKNEFEKAAKTYPYAQDIESERRLMEIAEEKQYTSLQTN